MAPRRLPCPPPLPACAVAAYAGAVLGQPAWAPALERPRAALAAAAALLLALLALLQGGRLPWTLLALGFLLLGLARSPVEDSPRQPGLRRPVRLLARFQSVLPDGEGGAFGWLEGLRTPQGRPLDREDRRLFFHTPVAPPPGSAGRELLLAGLLHAPEGRLRLDRGHWVLRGRSRLALLERLREAIRRRVDRRLDPVQAGLARAWLLGDRSGLPGSSRESYRRLGLLHLLAVSGLHLWVWGSLLARLLPGPLRRLRWPLLAFLALLAGAGPAVLRAGGALILREFRAGRGRATPAATLWAFPLLLELLLLPGRDLGPGFLLSYGATGALLALRPPAEAAFLLRLLLPSAAAFLGTAWILHGLQGTLEPWSIPATPLLAALLPLRLLASLGCLLPGLPGEGAAAILEATGGLEARLLAWPGPLPAAPWVLTATPFPAVAAACALGLGLLRPGVSRLRRLAGGLLLPLLLAPRPGPPGLALFPVGHGLAAVLADGREALAFDLGSREHAAAPLLDRILLPGLRRLRWPLPETAVLSHGDADHGNGWELLRRRHGLAAWARTGHDLDLRAGPGSWRLRRIRTGGGLPGVANDEGYVLEARREGFRAVLLGDQEGHALRRLIPWLEPGPVDLLLSPHHGLTTDGFAELLSWLRPREVWTSCGEGDLPLPVRPLLARRGLVHRTTLEGVLLWSPRP